MNPPQKKVPKNVLVAAAFDSPRQRFTAWLAKFISLFLGPYSRVWVYYYIPLTNVVCAWPWEAGELYFFLYRDDVA